MVSLNAINVKGRHADQRLQNTAYLGIDCRGLTKMYSPKLKEDGIVALTWDYSHFQVKSFASLNIYLKTPSGLAQFDNC
ncbi:hypothetical protein BGS_0186 [Beggiatoa sp. SS]|nr:hypothetical protein BGS_0186 [Beggiatoa sp. SS]